MARVLAVTGSRRSREHQPGEKDRRSGALQTTFTVPSFQGNLTCAVCRKIAAAISKTTGIPVIAGVVCSTFEGRGYRRYEKPETSPPRSALQPPVHNRF